MGERQRAGICMFYLREGRIYVLAGKETNWEEGARRYVEGNDVCSATLEFARLAEEEDANFAPIQRTEGGFKTIIRNGSDRYGIPKGGIDDDRPEIAALREFYEETGTLLESEALTHKRDIPLIYETGTTIASIFFIHVSEESAKQIVSNYETYFASIRYGELVEVAFYDVALLRGLRLNQETTGALVELITMIGIPPTTSETYVVPCKAMWERVESPTTCALTDLMINIHYLSRPEDICAAFYQVSKALERVALDAAIVELFGELPVKERLLVRKLARYVGDPAIIDIIMTRITSTNASGGKKTKKRTRSRARRTLQRKQKKRVQ